MEAVPTVNADPTHVPLPRALIARLVAVAACHILLGLVLSQARLVGSALLIELLISEAGLLGFASVLLPVRRSIRSLALAVGLVYLHLFAWFRFPASAATFSLWFVGFAAAMVVASGIARLRGFELRQGEVLSAAMSFPRPQFTMWHLFNIVTVAGVLAACTRWMLQAQMAYDEQLCRNAFLGATGFLCLMASIWAVLSVGRAWPRTIVALLLAITLGRIGGSLFPTKTEWWMWPTATTTQTMFEIVSLWVVRSCGYRLVRRRGMREASPTLVCEPGEEGIE